MKMILITGLNSYIGKSFVDYLRQYPHSYKIDTVSLRNKSWDQIDFSKYDVILHVAAIVHKKESPNMKNLYYKVNKDLAVFVAQKAKDAGVKQFIFMSTMSVYGVNGRIGKEMIISKDTPTKPNTYYGKSKLDAEREISKLGNGNFKIVIVRPPMVYGPNCPGNYATLEKIAKKIRVFPLIQNSRSMLHINNLCKFLKSYIDTNAEGLFLPQDDTYINTSLLVKKIGEQNGKKIYLSKTLAFPIRLFGKRIRLLNKVFGNLIYKI